MAPLYEVKVIFLGGPLALLSTQDHRLYVDNYYAIDVSRNLPSTYYKTDDGYYTFRGIDYVTSIPLYKWVSILQAEPKITEFYAESIIGWRKWNLVMRYDARTGLSNYRLASISSPTVWPPYELMKATCDTSLAIQNGASEDPYKTHIAPRWGCTCGIYAYKNKKVLRAHMVDSFTQPLFYGPTLPHVYGSVALEGDEFIVTEFGYRAQAAYPRHLFLHGPHISLSMLRRIADQLTDTYGIPCEIAPGLHSNLLTD